MKKLFKLIFSIFITFAFSASVYAASGKISVSSSTSKIVVGKQFTVTIKVSSSSKIGTWEFTPSYDKNKFKLVKGETPVVDFGDGKITSKTYKYTFKAIGLAPNYKIDNEFDLIYTLIFISFTSFFFFLVESFRVG